MRASTRQQTICQLGNIFSDSFAPRTTKTVSQHAEEERYLSPESSAKHGKWKNLPYQIGMQDVLNEEGVDIACFMTSTQLGKTETILNMITYAIDTDSGSTIFMLPSASLAKEYSKTRIGPLIRDTPCLTKIIPISRKDGNSVLSKSWKNGNLRLIGSQKADAIAGFPAPRLFVDELDRCTLSSRNSAGVDEGNPISLFLRRFTNWPNRFALFTSTPTIKGISQIEGWWEKSDKRFSYIPCIHCGHMQFLFWENFTWVGKNDENVKDDPSTVKYKCAACGDYFDDSTRFKWLKDVKWVKTNPKSKIAGFHINAFYSPWTAWEKNIEQYIEAKGKISEMMIFHNTVLGLPFSFEAMAPPDWEKLAGRANKRKRGKIPSKTRILIAGADVQADRIEVTIVGVYKRELFIVDHVVIPGATDDPDDELWDEFDEILKAEWENDEGAMLKIERVAIDSRHNKGTVARFARKRRVVVPVTGTPGNWDATVLPAKKMEIKRNGKWIKIGKKRYPLGVNLLKMDLYSRLKLKDGASSYIHFPSGLPDEYYKQIAGEVCEIEEDKRTGRNKYRWVPQYSNLEALDCMVYVLGLYEIMGLHRWTDERWALGEKMVASNAT